MRRARRMNRRHFSHCSRAGLRRCIIACFTLALAAGGFPARAQTPDFLDPRLLDPRVTQSTIVDTICRPGYVDEVLPPFDDLMHEKEQLLKQRRIDPPSASQYALDHRMPVLLGGSPTAQTNLDIRRWDGRGGQRSKERLTVFLKRCVCAGEMPLVRAQAAISGDWATRFPNLSSLTCNGQ